VNPPTIRRLEDENRNLVMVARMWRELAEAAPCCLEGNRGIARMDPAWNARLMTAKRCPPSEIQESGLSMLDQMDGWRELAERAFVNGPRQDDRWEADFRRLVDLYKPTP